MLIVRAQNQASGALRRVGRDLSAMGRHRNLQIQQQKVLLNQQNLMRQRQRALRELQSITQGSRALGLQRASAQIEKARNTLQQRRNRLLLDQQGIAQTIANAQSRLQRINNDLFRNETARLRLANRLQQVQAQEANALKQRRNLQARVRRGTADPAGVAPITQAIQALRRQSTILDRSLLSNADRQRELEQSSRLTSRAIGNQVARSALLGRQWRATGRDAELLAQRTQHVAARQRELALRANEVRAQLSGIAQRYAIVTAQQNALSKAIRVERWEKLSIAGRTMQHLGRVGQYATLVVGAGLGLAARQAAEFNKQATLVATQAGTVSGSFEEVATNATKIEAGLRAILPQTTATLDELNKSAYEVFSSTNLGSQGAKGLAAGLKLVGLFSKASIAGQTDLTKVTEAGITVFNSFGKNINKMPKIMNRMFAAVRFGRFTFEELSASMSQIAPAAVAANQSFDTVAGSAAFLSRHIPAVGMMRAAFARSLEMLNMPDFVDGMKKAGVAVRDASGRMRPLNQVIGDIVKRFPELKAGTKDVQSFYKEITAEGGGGKGRVGTIQGRRALTFYFRFFDQYKKLLGQTIQPQNSFNRALAAMETTTGVRWEKFLNQLRAFALMIGSAVLPELLKLAPHITKITDYLRDMDGALRGDIVRWIAYGVAITGVASALAFILGPLIRLAAMLGKNRLLFLGMGSVAIGVVAAIALLRGEWDGLNTIVSAFFNLTDQGAWGWVAMFSIATVGAFKLVKAINAVRTAWIASMAVTTAGTAASSLGGMAAMFGRGRRMASDVRGASSIVKETSRNAGKLRGLLAGAGLAAMAIPGPLWIAAGAIGVAAGGAFLWQRYQKSIAKDAERAQAAIQHTRATAVAPQIQAADLGNLGSRIMDARKLGIEYKRQELNLKMLRTQFKGATGDQKKMLGLDIQDAAIRVAEYYRMWHVAIAKVRQTAPQLTNAIRSQALVIQEEGRIRSQIVDVEKRLAAARKIANVQSRGSNSIAKSNVRDIQRELTTLRTQLQLTKSSAGATANTIRSSFGKVVRDLQAGALLPRKIPKGAIDAMIQTALGRGRMLTIPEIRAVIKAYVDKGALARAKGDIQAAVKTVKVDLRIAKLQTRSTNLQKQLRAAIHAGETGEAAEIRTKLSGVKEAIKNAKAARANIAATFRKIITQRVNVKVNPANTQPLGLAISNGIAAGIRAGFPNIDAAIGELQAKTLRAAQLKFEVGSPSRLFEREIGAPIIDGMIKGILNKEKIERAATLTMTLFAGAFMQKRQELIDNNDKFDPLKLEKLEQQAEDARARYGKKKRNIDLIRAKEYERKAAEMRKHAKKLTVADLIKDTRQQAKEFKIFNNALKSLSIRIPAQMLEDLRGLGIEGLQYIKLLANATPQQLKKMVNAWKAMQAQIKRSQTASIADTKEFNAAQKEQLKELTDTAAQTLLDKWNELKQRNIQQFGELFGGPTNLGDRIGQSFDDAIKQYDDAVKDFNDQIDALLDQVNDLHTQALKQRTEELQQAFGTLFGGQWMQDVMSVNADWGIAPTFNDLFTDLQSQLERFNTWRETLASLASKVPPELAAQLEALGPEAIQSLQALNGATAEQIAQYIALWQQAQGQIGATAGATYQTSEFASQLAELNSQILAVREQMALLQKPLAVTGQDVIADLDAQIGKWTEYETMLTELKNRGVPLALIAQLRDMGPEALPYLQALNTLTNEQLISGPNSFVGKWKEANRLINESTNTAMNEQLKMWYSHGANIASALIAGVASEQQALLDFFGKLFRNLLEGKFPTIPGTATGGGTQGYMYSSDPDSSARRAADYTPPANSTYSTNTQSTVNLTVNAHQDEELMSTMERALFRLRNRSE
jgi:TP901 family phage tail tape measure protein